MTKKYSLLSDIEGGKVVQPRRYQQFEAELGFEKLTALVPVENADLFEAAVRQSQPKGRAGLAKVAAQFGGLVE